MRTVCKKCNREIHRDKLSKTTSVGDIVPKERQVIGQVKYGLCQDCRAHENRQQAPLAAYESFRSWVWHRK